MNIAEQAQEALSNGFAAIVDQFKLPLQFPSDVVTAAELATTVVGSEKPPWFSHRRDATHIPFVTLDPASSTDLDQAFAIEKDGDELLKDAHGGIGPTHLCTKQFQTNDGLESAPVSHQEHHG